ncbi:hypothetical protein L2E82_30843 [Cichorium intybus]|uniref:Uncharacterized protein n=1 Tax=Cichorium intybus TaxID=13427 RepID=A0ACB9D1H2_CICIN|nr:hypothetical protein L2E82_30843 [Cichorium intybus]
MNVSLKVHSEIATFNSSMTEKFKTFFDDVQKYIDGIFLEHRSLRDNNILLLYLLMTTLEHISTSVRGLVDNLTLAAGRMEEAINKMENINKNLLATFSVDQAIRGGKVPPEVNIGENDEDDNNDDCENENNQNEDD